MARHLFVHRQRKGLVEFPVLQSGKDIGLSGLVRNLRRNSQADDDRIQASDQFKEQIMMD